MKLLFSGKFTHKKQLLIGHWQAQGLSQQIPKRLLASCSVLSLNHHRVFVLREQGKPTFVSD